MIIISNGDMFAANADALVNPVNCVGTMGKGLALQFKKRFPDAFHAYSHACADALIRPGVIFTYVEETPLFHYPITIFHLPTKRHWRDNSRLPDVVAGLDALRAEVVSRGVRSIAVPALGCGLGGLRWADVQPCIEHALGDLPNVNVLVFPPQED